MIKDLKNYFLQLINGGESESVEFKTSFDKETIETLCVFANTKGGSVFIGVNDHGEIAGTQIGHETLQQWANQVKLATSPALIPDIDSCEINGKSIVILSLIEYPVKPISCKGKYFKRIHRSNHQLSITEISNLHLQTFNTSWDHYDDMRHGLADISLEKVNQFIELVNKVRPYPIIDSPMTVLRKFELLSGEKISNGCFLLFAAENCFTSTIEVGRFSSETIIKDSLTIRTDLFSEVGMVLESLRKHMNRSYIITGNAQREERWDYPLEALREIVVNMIVHRDYINSSDSVIKIFDDRIEFFNPGRLFGNLSINQLTKGNYSSAIRNKQVASIFKEAGIIEKYGSGIKRVIDHFIAYGLSVPVFEEFQHGFKVTVCKTTQKTTQKKGTKNYILKLLVANPKMTREQLASELGKSSNTIKEHLAKLKNEGSLKRIGSDRDGHWKVIDKNYDGRGHKLS